VNLCQLLTRVLLDVVKQPDDYRVEIIETGA